MCIVNLPGSNAPSTAGALLTVTDLAVPPHNGSATTLADVFAGTDTQLLPLHEKVAEITLPPVIA